MATKAMDLCISMPGCIRQDEEGNWHKAEKMNDTNDWINIL